MPLILRRKLSASKLLAQPGDELIIADMKVVMDPALGPDEFLVTQVSRTAASSVLAPDLRALVDAYCRVAEGPLRHR